MIAVLADAKGASSIKVTLPSARLIPIGPRAPQIKMVIACNCSARHFSNAVNGVAGRRCVVNHTHLAEAEG